MRMGSPSDPAAPAGRRGRQLEVDFREVIQGPQRLTLRGAWLLLEAYTDSPIHVVLFGNLPGSLKRGKRLLDQSRRCWSPTKLASTSASATADLWANVRALPTPAKKSQSEARRRHDDTAGGGKILSLLFCEVAGIQFRRFFNSKSKIYENLARKDPPRSPGNLVAAIGLPWTGMAAIRIR